MQSALPQEDYPGRRVRVESIFAEAFPGITIESVGSQALKVNVSGLIEAALEAVCWGVMGGR